MIKFQGVGPIGIEDVFRTLVSAFLAITGKVVKRICGTDQLCNGFKASIEGGVHCVRSLWSIFLDNEDPRGVLLIDAHNAFNEGNRKIMVWATRQEWHICAIFVFNMYMHHIILILRGEINKMLSLFKVEKE